MKDCIYIFQYLYIPEGFMFKKCKIYFAVKILSSDSITKVYRIFRLSS